MFPTQSLERAYPRSASTPPLQGARLYVAACYIDQLHLLPVVQRRSVAPCHLRQRSLSEMFHGNLPSLRHCQEVSEIIREGGLYLDRLLPHLPTCGFSLPVIQLRLSWVCFQPKNPPYVIYRLPHTHTLCNGSNTTTLEATGHCTHTHTHTTPHGLKIKALQLNDHQVCSMFALPQKSALCHRLTTMYNSACNVTRHRFCGRKRGVGGGRSNMPPLHTNRFGVDMCIAYVSDMPQQHQRAQSHKCHPKSGGNARELHPVQSSVRIACLSRCSIAAHAQ